MSLEDVDDEAVIAAHIIGETLGGQGVVGLAREVLEALVLLGGGSVKLFVDLG